MQWQRWLALGLVIFVVLAGCAPIGGPMASQEKSLYERLGGKPTITAVVDDFTARVAYDRRLHRFFANLDVVPFKAKLVDQLCEASGGPCKYTGRDMLTVHQGMGMANADFDVMVEDFVTTLDKFKVPDREKDELLSAFEPMRKAIVTK